MTRLIRSAFAFPALALVLAGCSVAPAPQTTTMAQVQAPMTAPVQQASLPTPAQTTATARASTDAAAYVDAAAFGQLSDAARGEASSAQFYALQFGRPGAPRTWQSGAVRGSVSVGPYVRVNSLDCREFTHTVTIGAQTYTRTGTACREQAGNWSVVNPATA